MGSRRAWVAGVVLTGLLATALVLVVGIGSVPLPAADVLAVVARRLRLVAGADVTVLADQIVWDLRLPRALAAAAVGAALALCGVVLQSLTRNELADPYLLGLSSGAAVGAVTAIVFGVTLTGLTQGAVVAVCAFAGALTALAVVLLLATGRSGELPPSRTILAGVAVGQLCGAFTSLAIMVFGERDVARQVLAWTLGSFGGIRWNSAVLLVALALAATVGLLACARSLDAFAFGEVSARSLGVSVDRLRWGLMVGCALITAGTVAAVGPIGFVGLTVPHIVRLLVGPAHAALLPLSALAGALLLLLADTAARSLSTSEIPVGIVTAAIGAPVLVVLLRRQASRS